MFENLLCYVISDCLQDLADISYLLSPQDLMALQQLPAMIAAGVGCFKIEGRLKGPEYVAATTAAYRAGERGMLVSCMFVIFMELAGVGCFKIEGRLKGPEYVAATTAAYRAGEAARSA